jgi:SAM-dependent methyltransferase
MNLRWIVEAYEDQVFFPRWWSVLFNAFYLSRKGLVRAIARHAPKLKGVMLDFGCGSKPYARLFRVDSHLGVDIVQSGHDHSKSRVDVYYDGKTIPFADEHFDSVFASEVFEHVPNLDPILGELNRVLKPGGLMLVTMPWCWEEHEAPYDFRRYTEWGLKMTLEQRGFEVLMHEKTSTHIETVAQLVGSYLYKHFMRRRLVSRLLQFFVTAPLFFSAQIMSNFMPDNGNLYLNHVLLARKRPAFSKDTSPVSGGSQPMHPSFT